MTAAGPAGLLAEVARLFDAGQWAEGEAALDRLLAARPRDGALIFEAASLCERAGRDGAAQAAYERLAKLDRNSLPAWMNLGSLHLRQDRIGEAERCFRRALTISPRLPDAALGLGFVYLRDDRMAEAITAFARAADLDPRRPEALANLGAARLKAGDAAAAIGAFRKALGLWPGNPDLLCSLGTAELQAGDAAAAAATLDGLLAAHPGHVRALAVRGAAAIGMGDRETAARLLDADRVVRPQVLQLPPAYPDAAAFGRALAAAAASHPSLVRDRAGKTTRNGGQTGNLVDDTDPAISAVVQRVRGALAAFLAAEGGPPRAWRLNIWATVLDVEGHQATHNHPGGIASGVYYARVPPPIGSAEAGAAGFIEFGRPPPEFGAADESLIRVLRPVEGELLLFPSHLWHGTIPFRAEEPRVSIAFDAVPL